MSNLTSGNSEKIVRKNEPGYCTFYKTACASREDPDQHAHTADSRYFEFQGTL